MKYHVPVLLSEAIGFLKVKKNGIYIDATAGGGGHTEEILKRGGKVLALDRDPEAIENIKSKSLVNLTLVNSNFSHIYKKAEEFGFTEADGIIFDLGLSSHQLETGSKGFSFQKKGPLDMRMDPNIQITAFDLVNNLEKRRLDEVFKNYGQEKLSWAISDAIDSARKVKPIDSTEELAQIVGEVYRKKSFKTKISPATKVFQALRIVINSELINLEETLPQTQKLLKSGGRLVIISFHSLEDAIVKRFFKETKGLRVLTKKPIGPSSLEVQENPRSRSAKLRAAEKL